MIRALLKVWGVSLVALVAATTGMSALSAGSAVTSTPRMAFAAGVLSTYASFAALVFTDRAERTRARCLLWGAIPLLVGFGNALLVGGAAGPAAGLVSALPWLAGPALVLAVGPALPQVRRPRWLRLRAATRSDEA